MPNTVADEVIRKLQERVTRGELNGIAVTYRVTGGAPGEQPVDEELRLAWLGSSDCAPAHGRGGRAGVIGEPGHTGNAGVLLLQIGAGVGELIPRSQARFVPDSIVGQLSVQIDGQEAVFSSSRMRNRQSSTGKCSRPRRPVRSAA